VYFFQPPPFLQPGDCIGLAALSQWVDPEPVEAFKAWIQEKGFQIKEADNLYTRSGSLAGTLAARRQGFADLLKDNSIKAIWFVRGGYGAGWVLHKWGDDLLQHNPKWLIGFSDLTRLHLRCYRLGLLSLHADMPGRFLRAERENFEAALKTLQGQAPSYTWPSSAINQAGEAKGRLVGGNLSMLANAVGGPDSLQLQDEILFWEEVDEYRYAIDRMLFQLNVAGVLKNRAWLAGIAQNWHEQEPYAFSKTDHQFLESYLEKNTPSCTDAPFGHAKKNLPLVLGAPTTLKVNPAGSCVLQQQWGTD